MEACVIGVGNRWRKDDGIGQVVADKLKTMVLSKNADVFYIEERLFELQSYFERYKKVVLIDALPPETEPGKIQIWQINGSDFGLRRRLPQRILNAFSLHDLDLLWQIQSAFRNGYQGELMLIGIEVGTLGYGEGLSLQLRKALPVVISEVEQNVFRFLLLKG